MPAVTTKPTSSLHELHRISLIRTKLGRIGGEAIQGPHQGGPTAPLTTLTFTRDTADVSFRFGGQTERICLRPAHLSALGFALGDRVLVVVPETSTPLMVPP